MGKETGIPWCHHTFNSWRGCAKISPGCEHCYAEAGSHRNPKILGEWGPKARRSIAAANYWNEPIKWEREALAAGERRRVFSLSLGDVFEDRADLAEPREKLFATILNTPGLDWLLLTKRPENAAHQASEALGWDVGSHGFPPNVWFGISVENQTYFRKRLLDLLVIPATVKWISYEPALGPLTLRDPFFSPWRVRNGSLPLDWIVCGGESGAHARSFDARWARSLRLECQQAGIPFYMKQMGAQGQDAKETRFAWPCTTLMGKLGDSIKLHFRHPKGGDPGEWTNDLRVREFPEVAHAH